MGIPIHILFFLCVCLSTNPSGSTGINLGTNPKPYRQYLTFRQVYRLIEFLYIVWETSPNLRLDLRLVCC